MILQSEKKEVVSLNHLSDEAFEQNFRRAVRTERKILHIVILHVQELERRKLYFKKYSSLFEYLVKEMGYSAPCAQRRINAAKLAAEIPEVTSRIESGEINLTQINEIHRAVKTAEKIHQEKISKELKAEIIAVVSGQTTDQTQQACSEILNIPILETQKISTQANHSKRIEFTLTEEQFRKFEQVKGLLAQKHFQEKRTMEIADVLETCFDFILESKGASSKDEPARLTSCDSKMEVVWKSLTPKRKQFILKRDQCCQYKKPNGEICGSTFQLEIDHIRPRFAGGAHGSENLRVLCRSHNQLRYRVGG